MSSKFVLDLSRRTIVVTGGNRGIGLALSQAVAKAGANVAVIYRCLFDPILSLPAYRGSHHDI
jgi:NAD(P)-dependent dehydrogenase (short-subunit alcohol dehydrogenase family)